jgi:hypothetical protein
LYHSAAEPIREHVVRTDVSRRRRSPRVAKPTLLAGVFRRYANPTWGGCRTIAVTHDKIVTSLEVADGNEYSDAFLARVVDSNMHLCLPIHAIIDALWVNRRRRRAG